MKSTLVRSALTAAFLTVMSVGSAHANTITPNLVAWIPGVGIGYTAELSSGEIHAGDSFTIFDLGGLTGFSLLPADWTITFENATAVYGAVTGDNAGNMNVRFTYTGPSLQNVIAPNTFLGAFTLGTVSTTLVEDFWASRDHTIADPGVVGDGLQAAVKQGSTILVPAGVPDGGSTMMLLGFGMLAAGAVRRKLGR